MPRGTCEYIYILNLYLDRCFLSFYSFFHYGSRLSSHNKFSFHKLLKNILYPKKSIQVEPKFRIQDFSFLRLPPFLIGF